MIYTIIKRISKIISYLIPINDSLYVFHSFPFFTDNSYALYKKIIEIRPDIHCIWIADNKKETKNYYGKEKPIKVYSRFSFKGIWCFFRAKYIFCTHGVNGFLSLRQSNKIVNLWHGMSLKAIGSFDPKTGGDNKTYADYLIATSQEFRTIMSKAFNNMPLERVLLVGQPRNDMLFEPTSFFFNKGIDRDLYRKIGIMLPTYKLSYVGDIRQDGIYNEKGLFFLTWYDLNRLNEKLKDLNDLIIIKLHPMDILQTKELPKLSNIIILKQNDLTSQLYPLLGNCDYLITDYSSVWIDFEILNKPIGFAMNDIEQYQNSRGFCFEDIDGILPGPLLNTYDKLVEFCEQPDMFNYPRNNRFNIYKDNKSSERLLKKLNIIK